MYFGKIGYSQIGTILANRRKKQVLVEQACQEQKTAKETELWALLKTLKPKGYKNGRNINRHT